MRITFNSQYRNASAGIETATNQLIEAQRQVTTGRRISRPSDDPSGAAMAAIERTRIAAADQYERAADSTNSRLSVIDSALSDIIDRISAAQTTALKGMGTIRSADEREAAAQTLEGIRATLMDDFNTSFHGSFVFAGAQSTTKPYALSGTAVGAYAASTTEVQVDIGEEESVTVAFNGTDIAKGTAAKHVFDVIDDLVAAIRAGDDTTAHANVTELGNAFTRATTAQTRVGVGMKQIEGQKTRLQDTKLATSERLSRLEDADMAAAITEMTKADAAYRAALGAIGTATKVSLMDYLK